MILNVHSFILAYNLTLHSLGVVQLMVAVALFRSIPELKCQPVSLHGLAVLVHIQTLDPALKVSYLPVDPGALSHHTQILGRKPATDKHINKASDWLEDIRIESDWSKF